MPIQQTEIQQTERLLREMVAEKAAQEAEDSRNSLMNGLFAKKDWPQPPKAQFPRLKKVDRRGDFVIAALGVTLGLICALFPWYIFYNQEQFGVQAIKFGGKGNNSGRIMIDPQEAPGGTPLALQDMPKRNLDLFSTGAIPDRPLAPEKAPALDRQPFPAETTAFRLVHVANGRAMIEDDTGLWLVQRGSTLPDSSRVASIELRAGKWVLVTSTDQVVAISR